MKHLTRRGWIVLVIIPGALALLGIWEISLHLWWTGDAYCWGTYTECFSK